MSEDAVRLGLAVRCDRVEHEHRRERDISEPRRGDQYHRTPHPAYAALLVWHLHSPTSWPHWSHGCGRIARSGFKGVCFRTEVGQSQLSCVWWHSGHTNKLTRRTP